MRRTPLLSLFCMSLLALAGCSAINIKLGRRVDLAKTPVTAMEVSLPKGPAIAPGQKAPLVATVTEPDGRVLLTEGEGKGKVRWKDLKVTATIVTADQKGNISLSRDPRVSDGKIGHVAVEIPSQPSVTAAELEVPFRYNVAFVSNFSGAAGSPGSSGSDGQPGSAGSSGSTDPNSPSPGGNGGNGTDGGNGGDGGPGGNAPAVLVQMTRQPGATPLLQISVSATSHRRLYLVDPAGGTLTVKADGGPGGPGGRGGRGGQGGAGGSGIPSGNSGSNGADGRSGDDGPTGRGGQITVAYDPSTQPYLDILHLSSRNGPSPTLREQPVAPLW